MMTKTKYAIAILLLIFCDGCGYDRFEDLPDTEERSTAESNASLSMLMERYYGDRTVITDDLVLSGMISANDESGNFYRSFVVEDESGAVEVCAGFYDVYRFYPKGHRVTIHAVGLALGCYYGVIQMGL